MKLQDQITANLSRNLALKRSLQVIADDNNLSSHLEVVQFLVDFYENKATDSPRPKPSAPAPSAANNPETTFLAPYHPRVAKYVEQMRDYYLEEHQAATDSEILKAFFQLTHKLKEKSVFLVPAAKKVSALIVEKSQEAIDMGAVKSEGDWIAREITKLITSGDKPKKEEKEKSSWW